MGGGSGSNKNEYEAERKAVSRRGYGKLASDGFQNQEQFDAISGAQEAFGRIKQSDYTYKVRAPGDNENDRYNTYDDVGAFTAARQATLGDTGLAYNDNFDRWTMGNGVDLGSAQEDWGNYQMERGEIATYEAGEASIVITSPQ
jgi:Neuraminidase (sialidase)